MKSNSNGKSNGFITLQSKLNHDFKHLNSDLPGNVNDNYYKYEKGGGLKENTYLYGLYIINGHWLMMDPLRMLTILEEMAKYWHRRDPRKTTRIQEISKKLIDKLAKRN